MKKTSAFISLASVVFVSLSNLQGESIVGGSDYNKKKIEAFQNEKKAENHLNHLIKKYEEMELNRPESPDIIKVGMNNFQAAMKRYQTVYQEYLNNLTTMQKNIQYAQDKYKQTRDTAAPFHEDDDRLKAEEQNRKALIASKQAEETQRNQIIQIKKYAENIVSKQASEVSDPESGKDGGPATIEVLKLYNGTGSDFVKLAQQNPDLAMLQMLNIVKIKEIKRGTRLTSLVSLQIPTGTTVFPIRLVLEDPNGVTTNQDLYYYKDDFGEWASVSKN